MSATWAILLILCCTLHEIFMCLGFAFAKHMFFSIQNQLIFHLKSEIPRFWLQFEQSLTFRPYKMPEFAEIVHNSPLNFL